MWPYVAPGTNFEDFAGEVSDFVQRSLKRERQQQDVIHSILRSCEILLVHQHHSRLPDGEILETFTGRKRAMVPQLVAELKTLWPCKLY